MSEEMLIERAVAWCRARERSDAEYLDREFAHTLVRNPLLFVAFRAGQRDRDAEIEALEAKIAEQAQELVRRIGSDESLPWRSIETAPRDGTLVIVWPPTREGATSCARFHDDRFAKKPRPYWNRSDTVFTGSSRGNPPTHWRPVLSGPGGER